MNDDPYADRRELTFEQAEGAAPLPAQLQLKEISRELRARLWFVVYEYLKRATIDDDMGYSRSHLDNDWSAILYNYHVVHDHGMADEFTNIADELTSKLKTVFSSGNYVRIFGFLQFVLRHPRCPPQLARHINGALSDARAAYCILDQQTIVPVASDAERVVLEQAFADLTATEFRGARGHLNTAGSELTAGNYADSIRESIHAVESVARTLEPSGMLSEALSKLEKSAAIHPALKRGFLSIYGYTNDEKGIRHPLLDDPQAKVDEADALFMIGACAAFVSYMIHKARLAGLLAKR
jgi:hypothetical protein